MSFDRKEWMTKLGLSRRTHGFSGTSPGEKRKPGKAYQAWMGMKQRCLCPTSAQYHDYGGRGIIIHPDWVEDFAAFYSCVGEPPSPKHMLDRENNNGNYEPGNVRWVTRLEQNRNRRNVQWLEFDGIKDHVVGWANRIGLSHNALRNRLKKGMPIEIALTKKTRIRNPHPSRMGLHKP